MNASRIGLVARALLRARAVGQRERWSRDQLESFQMERLRELIARVGRDSPFYRRAWGGVPGPDVTLSQLPSVQRGALMAEFEDATTDRRLTRSAVDEHLRQAQGDPLLFGEYRVMASSGSTGEPGRFIYSPRGWDAFLDGLLRWTRWMGVRPRWPRMRIAAIGAPDARHMTYRGAASIDVGVYDSLRLAATDPLPDLVDRLNRHRPQAINAYPSVLELLAEEKLAGRLRAEPAILCTSSEQRMRTTAERIARAFGVRPFDCYALTETGVTAVDCERHDGLHVFEDQTIVEIEDGRVLMTNLFNDALPMIRVEVSDLLVEKHGPCACGRTFRRLEAVEGRADDVLRLASRDGGVRAVHPLRLRALLGAIPGVVQYRASWHVDLTVVEVIASPGAPGIEDAVTLAVRRFCDENALVVPAVEIRRCSAFTREGTAKLKVVRQLGTRADS